MNLTPEQIAAAHKANLETLTGLTTQALKSIEQLVELNMQIAKSTLTDNVEKAKKTLEIKDVQQLIQHQSDMVQPMAEKIMSYSRSLYEIAQEAQQSMTKVAESEIKETQKKMQEMMENWQKNAPAGSDAAIQAMKQAIAAATNTFESSQKAVKHAIDVAQNNMNSATESLTKVVSSAAKASKK